MERLINSDSMGTHLWNPIILKNPEDGGNRFPKTSVLTRATQYKVPEGIYNTVACLLKVRTVKPTEKALANDCVT
jgi:hypothetical protein